MRALLIVCLFGLFAAAIPVTAQAHWHHPHRGWHRGPSYYPDYGFYDANPYGPVCSWRRGWGAFWYRDCF